MKEWKSWCILSISCSFMFFMFAPLEVYLTNIQEFWFYAKDLFPIVSACFALAAALLATAGLLLKKTRIFPYAAAVFVCLYIGLYIQGNFMPRNYGVLDGKEIDWAQYSHYGVMSAVLWMAMVILCILLIVKLSRHIYSVCQYTGIMISLILMATLVTLFFQNIRYEEDKNAVVVSQKDMFSLSDRNNFIVLLYDTFDSSYLREILDSADGDAYRETLADFTYYPNAVGGYPTTKASMPFILTGEWYENEQPYADYVDEAYGKTDFYDFLQRSQYTVGVYTMGMFLSKDADMYINAEKGVYSLSNIPGFIGDVYKLAGFNYLPHALKKYAVVYSGDFNRYAKINSDEKAYALTDVPEFNDLLKESGVSVEEKESNAFRFYHLVGTHPDYEFGEDLRKDGKDYTAVDEARGCVRSLKSYCDLLKDAGVYDKSTIVVMADHGIGDHDLGSNPVFMIKEAQAESEFRVSDLPVSWEDLLPTMKTLIAGGKQDGDIWSLDAQRSRRFLAYSWDDSWGAESLPRMTECMALGDPGDDSYVLLPTGNLYSYAGFGREEENGDIYTVDGKAEIPVDDESWDDFSLYGVSFQETSADGKAYRWTCERAAMFRFRVKDADRNYRVSFNYNSQLQENSVEGIKAIINGRELAADAVKVEDNRIQMDISSDFLAGNDVTVIMEFPNAASPKELGIGEDARKLSVDFSGASVEGYAGYE